MSVPFVKSMTSNLILKIQSILKVTVVVTMNLNAETLNLNPLHNCGCDVESKTNFFLHCSFLMSEKDASS